MSKDLKKLTTFLTRFDTFKYLVIPFSLYNKPASLQHLINFLYCLYKYTLTIFLSTVKCYKITIFIFAKFYHSYKSWIIS